MLRSSLLIPRTRIVRHNLRNKFLLPALCSGLSSPGVTTMAQRSYKAVIFDMGGVVLPPPFQVFRGICLHIYFFMLVILLYIFLICRIKFLSQNILICILSQSDCNINFMQPAISNDCRHYKYVPYHS